MKTIRKFLTGLGLAAVVFSCSTDDEALTPVSPVRVGFAPEMSVMEQNGRIDLPLELSSPATSTGIIIVKVTSEDYHTFETVPAIVAGEIEIAVSKGATTAVLGFIPQDDQVLTEDRIVTLEISSESVGFVPAENKSITITITDNEIATAATFLAGEGAVEEDS